MSMITDKLNKISGVSNLRKLNFILAFAVIGVVVLSITSAAVLAGFYGSVENDQYYRINARRADIGRRPLFHTECLHRMAEDWAKEMANSGFRHRSSLADADKYCGNNWTYLGENIGTGEGNSSAQIFTAFMNSPGHKANIENGIYTHVGVGAYRRADNKLFIVHNFATCSNCSGTWSDTANVPKDPISPPPPVTTTFRESTVIKAGEQISRGTMIFSSNREYFLAFQEDGNLVMYKSGSKNNSKAIWSSKTYYNGNSYGILAAMQGDGNFVVYRKNGSACHSNTSGSRASSAIVQNDGNFVLYTKDGKAVWSILSGKWSC